MKDNKAENYQANASVKTNLKILGGRLGIYKPSTSNSSNFQPRNNDDDDGSQMRYRGPNMRTINHNQSDASGCAGGG